MLFDLNLAKEKSNKNPVFYVQYAHVRICSVLEKYNELDNNKPSENNLSLLKSEKELNLISHLVKFPELLMEISNT